MHKNEWGDGMKINKNNTAYSVYDKIGGIRMNICGNTEVDFEGCKSVVEYCSDSIKLNTGKYIVAFKGRGLKIRCMTEYGLIISGYIISIEYIM